MSVTRDDMGCLEPEGDDANTDCLAIVLCTYFSRHVDRPDDDVETENDGNYHWGEWVMMKVNETLDEFARQINSSSSLRGRKRDR